MPSIAHLVRRQRADRRADLVRGIAQEPRPLSRQLRPPQPHHRTGDASRRPERDLVAVEPVAGHAVVRRCLARRFVRRHAFLERLARGPRLRALPRRASALLLGVRLPVVPVQRRGPPLRHQRRRPERRLAGHGMAPEECRRQCAHRRDHAALFPLSRRASRISSISARSSKASRSRRRWNTGAR